MFHFILTGILNGLAVWLGAQFLRGVQVTDFYRALIVGLVVAFLNATIGSMLGAVPTPVRFGAMGLFGLVISALMFMLADYFLKGLTIKNFWWALALAAIVTVVNSFTFWFFSLG